jgi:hypothetical protein
LRRARLGAVFWRGSDREVARLYALRWTTRSRHRAAAVRRSRCLIVCGFGLIGPWRGSLTRPQCGRPPLLNRPCITSNRGEIGSHGRGCAGAGSIMLPQKCRAGRPDFPRTAVTRVAGIGEDLRGRLSGVEVRLCPCRRNRRPCDHRDDGPGPGSSNPRHGASPFQLILSDPCCHFLAKRGCGRADRRKALFSRLLRGKRVAANNGLCFNSSVRRGPWVRAGAGSAAGEAKDCDAMEAADGSVASGGLPKADPHGESSGHDRGRIEL